MWKSKLSSRVAIALEKIQQLRVWLKSLSTFPTLQIVILKLDNAIAQTLIQNRLHFNIITFIIIIDAFGITPRLPDGIQRRS